MLTYTYLDLSLQYRTNFDLWTAMQIQSAHDRVFSTLARTHRDMNKGCAVVKDASTDMHRLLCAFLQNRLQWVIPCMKLFNSDYWEEDEHLLDQESGGTYIHKLHIPPVPAYSIVYTYIHRYMNNTFILVQIAKGRQRIMNAVSNLNLLTALITP